MEERMFDIADKYKSLRIKKDDLQFELKELNEQIEQVETQLLEEMTSAEVTNFKRNGSTFSMVTKEYPSAVVEKKSELYDMMKQQGYEHLFTINTNTLSATVKELKSNNDNVMPDWLDGLIQVAEKQTIQLRK